MTQKLLDELGVDRLPYHMRGKRVTELMSLATEAGHYVEATAISVGAGLTD